MLFSRRTFIKGGIAMAGTIAAESFNPALSAGSGNLFPAHPPLGTPQGIFKGRVVWTHNPEAVHWDGVNYWWQPENFDSGALLEMINARLMTLTGGSTPAHAWSKLFEWRNSQNGIAGGYRPGQKIAIKTNMNGAGEYNDDPHGQHAAPYGNPALLQMLLKSLVSSGGVRPHDITVYDTCRIFPIYMREMCSKGDLDGVNFRHRDPGGKLDSTADKNALIRWAEKFRGEPTYLPTCLTEADYLINLANLKGHSWGMTLTAKNHFGSIVNSDRRNTAASAGLHPNIINAKMGDYSVLTDLISNKHINRKTILWMLDAIITAPSETGSISPTRAKWKMPPFNGEYASSLFFSLDPVAIDSVGADFLANEPVMLEFNREFARNHGMENYLHEAALLPNPPSKTQYANDVDGQIASLGVHEHWNNPEDKQYHGNLFPGKGIELVYLKTGE